MEVIELMETKKLAGTILSVSIKVCVFALVVVSLYFFGRKAYTFGVDIFDEKSVNEEGEGYDVSITIPEGASNSRVADILLENGIITDKRLFLTQLMLSDYSKSIKPGTYTLNTTMKPTEIMVAISPVPKESEENEQ